MFVKNYYDFVKQLYSTESNEIGALALTKPDGSNFTPYIYNLIYNGSSGSKYYSKTDLLLLHPTSIDCAGIITDITTTIATSNTTLKSWGFALGDGDTSPTLDDYTLSGNLITTISVISTEYSRKLINNVSKWMYSAIIKNTGDKTITIKEVCAFHAVAINGIYANPTNTWVMMERTVLDEPIIIEPSNTATISYSVSTPIPTAPTE